jgi:hypothetical protein
LDGQTFSVSFSFAATSNFPQTTAAFSFSYFSIFSHPFEETKDLVDDNDDDGQEVVVTAEARQLDWSATLERPRAPPAVLQYHSSPSVAARNKLVRYQTEPR